jgi:hypothetical protein
MLGCFVVRNPSDGESRPESSASKEAHEDRTLAEALELRSIRF